MRVGLGLGVESCSGEAVSGELLLFVIRSILWKQAPREGFGALIGACVLPELELMAGSPAVKTNWFRKLKPKIRKSTTQTDSVEWPSNPPG